MFTVILKEYNQVIERVDNVRIAIICAGFYVSKMGAMIVKESVPGGEDIIAEVDSDGCRIVGDNYDDMVRFNTLDELHEIKKSISK